MTRGKPWTVQEETQLKELVEAKVPLHVIAARLGKREGAVFVKCQRLGLVQKSSVDSGVVSLPNELPSVEEALKRLAYAMEQLSLPGLDKAEVQRLNALVSSAKAYKEILVDFINYREIEAKLDDMEAKYAALQKQAGKNAASQHDSAQMEKAAGN